MQLKLSNNAIGTLVSSMTVSDTSVVLAPGQGAKFPALVAGEWFPITVIRASEPTQFEIMHATARSGDVLTVTRAREGTVAITFSVGDIVEHRLTKDALDRDFVRLGPDSLESVRFGVAADGSNLKATVHADGKEEELARQKDLGTAATKDTGTGPDEVPTNSDLGAAAYLPIATTSQAQGLTNDAAVITPKKLGDVLNASGVWVTRAIGEEVWLDDSNPAVEIPPTDSPLFRYIKLTAGENGSGGYNEGVLINEVVSGSAPLIEATAEINLPDSPFHGQTVRLLNTERRFVRAGDAGVVQDDQMQRITGGFALRRAATNKDQDAGAFTTSGYGPNQNAWGGEKATYPRVNFDSADSPDARTSETTDGETRPRNIGRTVYMRVL